MMDEQYITFLIQSLETLFNAKVEKDNNILFISVSKEKYSAIANYMKKQKFTRLLTVSAIDWIEKEEFEVYFLIHNLEENIYAKISTRIPRNAPEIDSLASIWKNSAMHERETWELFGITFKGNNMLKPLLTENWKSPPPFRKDFNWREYVKEKYGIAYPSLWKT